jgi:hypothetical protein
MSKKNILVFPCGSEVALEFSRCFKYNKHFHLIGASSTRDHGIFAYESYIEDVPFINDEGFIDSIVNIIKEYNIDAIFPAMDQVILKLLENKKYFNVPIISSSLEAARICCSKQKTYDLLEHAISTPKIYKIEDLKICFEYPLFIKPDNGYGSRNTHIVHELKDIFHLMKESPEIKFIITEYLPGDEWTIDCFTDRNGTLKVVEPRKRIRTFKGISVNTKSSNTHKQIFENWAATINSILPIRGAWFFQAKNDTTGQPKLLEIGLRISGSSGINRFKGINLALLSAYTAFDVDVNVLKNNYNVNYDRALSSEVIINIKYDSIYVDLDDCIIVDGKINECLIAFIYKCINKNKQIVLITRHAGDLERTLKKFRIQHLFDKVIHITNRSMPKSKFIEDENIIFIDDSFAERMDVKRQKDAYCFTPDMIAGLDIIDTPLSDENEQ